MSKTGLEIKARLKQIPRTRQGRMESILATIRAHPEGLLLQPLISTFTQWFGLKRKTVVDYFKELQRVKFIRIGRNMNVYPIYEKGKK